MVVCKTELLSRSDLGRTSTSVSKQKIAARIETKPNPAGPWLVQPYIGLEAWTRLNAMSLELVFVELPKARAIPCSEMA